MIRNSSKSIIIQNNCVLLVQRKDHNGNWCLFPGGGQNQGESLKEALIRECWEELGAKIKVGPLKFIREYIGKNHEFSKEDKEFHQVEFYFLCELLSPNQEFVPNIPDPNQMAVKWVGLDDLSDWSTYPKFLTRKHLLNPEFHYYGDKN